MILFIYFFKGARRVSSFFPTYGYQTRRMAIDYGVPLITDVKCMKFMIAALHSLNKKIPKLKTQIDCMSSERLVRIPGLIDTHVHLRFVNCFYTTFFKLKLKNITEEKTHEIQFHEFFSSYILEIPDRLTKKILKLEQLQL